MAGDGLKAIDGRRARRERGRVAAAAALIDLVFEGYSPPTADQIAERAGVSSASLFRYFETLDELRDEAASEYFDRFAGLFEVPEIGEGSLVDRIKNLTTSRVRLYEETEPMARLVRHRAPDFENAADMVSRIRSTLADQFSQHFDAELGRMSKAERADVIAVGSTLTSFESWEQMRQHHQRSQPQIIRAWSGTLLSVLEKD